MSKYASSTSVSAEKSKAEIERTLARYGASHFVYGTAPTGALVQFNMNDRSIRFTMALPQRNDREFTHTPSRGQERTRAAADEAYDQAIRQRWRALALVIKAKLEAVESEIETFEEAFMSHIVLPDGGTVGDWMLPQIADIYLSGAMPPMLPMLEAGSER